MKKIIIHRSKDKQYYYTVVAANGEVIVTSETYTRKSNCRKGIKAIIAFFYKCEIIPDWIKIVDKTKKWKP